MGDLIHRHTGGVGTIHDFLGKDASKIFPRIPPADLPNRCLANQTSGSMENLSEPKCVGFSKEDVLLDLPDHCHSFATGTYGIEKLMGQYRKGTLAYSLSYLADQDEFDWIVVNSHVYDVTEYVKNMKDPSSYKIDEDSRNAYLNENLNKMIIHKLNEDATKVFEHFYGPEVSDDYRVCLDELFYAGSVDDRGDPVCDALNSIMYFMLIFVAATLLLQCLCSLLYVSRRNHILNVDMLRRQVMVMVPCYNEGDKELRKTIKSVLMMEHPGDNKVLMIVADGVITGRGESMSTPETLSKILGFSMNEDQDMSYSYKSIGSKERNRAFVYYGKHEKDHKELKYVVVVKCGTTAEKSSLRRGNRGKRDSQLIIAGLLNRVHYARKLYELDVAICRALLCVNISVEGLTYLMAIDADTRVHKDSAGQMICTMEKDEQILACCGETRVDNKTQSWVTIIQVYEYYASHHLKKAFESVFGCVTCLPGCFAMYRIKSDDERALIANDFVFGEYARNDIESIHEKNLYHLGEDRMLTTLLLQHFPDMKLSFVPEATCWTTVPHTFKILLSQRRRWINSTLHNMLELLKVKTMCGICCFSMKTVIVCDLIATVILPASLVYVAYFLYCVIIGGEKISSTIIFIYVITLGCQVVVFLFRSRWDYFFWFLAYFTLGIPVFYFILPLYSFWHMDDLSWGQTRQIEPEGKNSREQAIK